MCKAPKPPKPKEPDKPEWLRNPYLDAAMGQSGAVDQMRSGRSSLRIPLSTGLAIQQPRDVLPNVRQPTAPATSVDARRDYAMNNPRAFLKAFTM